MPSATVPDQYPTIGSILDPAKFSLDTTPKLQIWISRRICIYFENKIEYIGIRGGQGGNIFFMKKL